jgi:hypothetical protein
MEGDAPAHVLRRGEQNDSKEVGVLDATMALIIFLATKTLRLFWRSLSALSILQLGKTCVRRLPDMGATDATAIVLKYFFESILFLVPTSIASLWPLLPFSWRTVPDEPKSTADT